MSAARTVMPAFQETPLAALQLMRLSSPLLPIGAFAYSQGLEQAVESGWVRNAAQLREWLEGLLTHALVATDLPVLRLAHAAWGAGDTARAGQLVRLMLALRESAELRAEEATLGSSLLRLLAQQGVAEAERAAGEPTAGPQASYVVSYALAAVHYGVSCNGALHGYCFAWLENQVSAALRCMSLGQGDAQSVLSSLLALVPEVVNESKERGTGADGTAGLGLSCPGLAQASAHHETLYSRLFRS